MVPAQQPPLPVLASEAVKMEGDGGQPMTDDTEPPTEAQHSAAQHSEAHRSATQNSDLLPGAFVASSLRQHDVAR